MSHDDTVHAGTVNQLLRAIGSWTAPTGRGLFMVRMITVSCTASAFSGTAFAFLSAWFFHLGAPGFAFGSCFGFCLGTLYYWKHTMSESVAAYRHFPTLMLLHLRRNFPTFGFENYRVEAGGERGRRELERFDRRFEREWSVRCLMMSAYQTAGPAIEEINARREAKVIAELSMESAPETDGEEEQQPPPLKTATIY